MNEVLERHWMLPLNSPADYPQYNGSMERSMRDWTEALVARRAASLMKGTPFFLEVEATPTSSIIGNCEALGD